MQLHNKHTVKVQIWDTSGQERFLSLTKNFLKGSNGAVIVFDITDRKSFEDLEQWIESIKENIDIDTLPIVLLGNKVDLECNRQVSTEEAEHLAKAEKFKYFETSSKNNTGIDEAFQYLAEEMYKVVHTNSSSKGKITINDKKKKKKKCCK
jgi:small GTP-binding protein